MATKPTGKKNALDNEKLKESLKVELKEFTDDEIEAYHNLCIDWFEVLFDKWKKEKLSISQNSV